MKFGEHSSKKGLKSYSSNRSEGHEKTKIDSLVTIMKIKRIFWSQKLDQKLAEVIVRPEQEGGKAKIPVTGTAVNLGQGLRMKADYIKVIPLE